MFLDWVLDCCFAIEFRVRPSWQHYDRLLSRLSAKLNAQSSRITRLSLGFSCRGESSVGESLGVSGSVADSRAGLFRSSRAVFGSDGLSERSVLYRQPSRLAGGAGCTPRYFWLIQSGYWSGCDLDWLTSGLNASLAGWLLKPKSLTSSLTLGKTRNILKVIWRLCSDKDN